MHGENHLRVWTAVFTCAISSTVPLSRRFLELPVEIKTPLLLVVQKVEASFEKKIICRRKSQASFRILMKFEPHNGKEENRVGFPAKRWQAEGGRGDLKFWRERNHVTNEPSVP